MQRPHSTPSAEIEPIFVILFGFAISEPCYAQSNVQSAFDDTDTIGLIALAVGLAVLLIASKLNATHGSQD
jgi:hypothetical protein